MHRFIRSIEGFGEPLILIPGLGFGGSVFEQLNRELSKSHTVYILELPGHDAQQSNQDFSLTAFSVEIAEFIRSLPSESVCLGGWSLGATVVWDILSRSDRPDNITSSIVIEQTPRIVSDGDWSHAAYGDLTAQTALELSVRISGHPKEIAYSIFLDSIKGSTNDLAILAGLAADAAAVNPKALAQLWEQAVISDYRHQISQISVPTLLIFGGRSFIYPSNVGKWLYEQYQNARLVNMPTAGHIPFLSNPKFCVDLINDHIASNTQAGPA